MIFSTLTGLSSTRSLLLPFLLLAMVSCQTPPTTILPPIDGPCDLTNWLDGSGHEEGIASVTSFIRAECHLSRGESKQALDTLWDILRSEANGSSIAGFALWRILQEFSPNDASDDVFTVADLILNHGGQARRLFELDGIQFTGTSLIYFQADIWAALSQLAWERDMPFRSALYGYLAGVKGLVSQPEHRENLEHWIDEHVNSESTREEQQLTKLYLGAEGDIAIVRDYWREGGKRELMHAKQLQNLRLFRQAVRPLRNALSNEDIEVRLRAYIDLCRIGRRIGLELADRLEIIEAAIEDGERNSATAAMLQEAFIQRGRILDIKHRQDPWRAIQSYEKATNICTKQDCEGDLTHEAIYLIARRLEQAVHSAEDEDDRQELLDLTREKYETLRSYRNGEHSRGESAYFRAALLEYGEGRNAQALRLLEELATSTPYPSRGDRDDSRMYQAALFWLGRIYLEQGLAEESAKMLTKLLPSEGPHRHRKFISYYGIRAMMLQNGQGDQTASSSRTFPDSITNQILSTKYATAWSTTLDEVCDSNRLSISLRRFCWGLGSGVFRWARQEVLKAWTTGSLIIGRNDPHYILDAVDTLVPLAIWRSMRSDLFNEGSFGEPTNRLYFAQKLAEIEDWNTAVMVLRKGGTLADSPGHLAGAFPPTYVDDIRAAASGDTELAEFIYAVMRQESMFSETALSRSGAFGLFQFMPRTFEETLGKFEEALRKEKGREELAEEIPNPRLRETFLAHPSRAIDLASFWLAERKRRHPHSLVLAAMEHNAGMGNVNRWFYDVENGIRSLKPEYSDDIEWLVEMAWGAEARTFAQRFFTNLAIARAAKMFEEPNVSSRAE